MCKKSIEQCQKGDIQSQSHVTAQEFTSGHLKAILRKLESVNNSSYQKVWQQYDDAVEGDSRIQRDSDSLRKHDDTQADEEVKNMFFDIFDGEGLLDLYEDVKCNGQWRHALRCLELPMGALRELHRHKSSKDDNDRRRQNEIEDLLGWLSSSHVVPISPTYNDAPNRQTYETALESDLGRHTDHRERDPSMSKPQDCSSKHLKSGTATVLHHYSGSQDVVENLKVGTVRVAVLDQLNELLLNLSKNFLVPESAEPKVSWQAKTQSSDTASGTHHSDLVSIKKEEALSQEQTSEPSVAVAITSTEPDDILQREAVLRENLNNKMIEQSARDHQVIEAYCDRICFRFHRYDAAIEQLKAFQYGGPHPNLVEFQVPDVQACYYRLIHIWKKLGLERGYNIVNLGTDPVCFHAFAIGMREAHFLLHALVYYGDQHTRLRQTGWSLKHMRSLQCDMTDTSYDLPFIHSKLDVDMICVALGDAFPGEDSLERPPSMMKHTSASSQPPLRTHTQHGNNMQSSVNHVNDQNQAASNMLDQIHVQIPTGANPSEHMDVDTVPICPDFKRSVCMNVDCRLDHPASERKSSLCPSITPYDTCKWGIKCNHSHPIQIPSVTIVPPSAQQSSQPIVAGPSNGASNFTNVNPYQSGGQGVIQQDYTTPRQIANSKKPCRYETDISYCTRAGCEFLHSNPRSVTISGTVQPLYRDAAMGDAASSGDTGNNAMLNGRPTKSETKCKYEDATAGRPCTNVKCEFKHEYANSKRFGSPPFIPEPGQQAQNNGYQDNGNGNRGRGGRGGRGNARGGTQRAANNYTYDPQQQPVQFQHPQQAQQIQALQTGVNGQWQHDRAPQNQQQQQQQQFVPQNQQRHQQGQQNNNRQQKGGRGNDNRTCRGCQQTGHIMRNCPNKNGPGTTGAMGPLHVPAVNYKEVQGGQQGGGYAYAESAL